MNDTSKLIGENGSTYFDSTADTEVFAYMVIVQEDTVINTLKEKNVQSDTAVDVTGSSDQNVSGKTLKQGAILTPEREFFSDISLTSGSVILYNYK